MELINFVFIFLFCKPFYISDVVTFPNAFLRFMNRKKYYLPDSKYVHIWSCILQPLQRPLCASFSWLATSFLILRLESSHTILLMDWKCHHPVPWYHFPISCYVTYIFISTFIMSCTIDFKIKFVLPFHSFITCIQILFDFLLPNLTLKSNYFE